MMKAIKVSLLLGLTYVVSWFLMVAVGLSNDRTEALMFFAKILMFFVLKILAFPMNLFDSSYPFLIDNTGKAIVSNQSACLLIGINFGLQLGIILVVLRLKKRRTKT